MKMDIRDISTIARKELRSFFTDKIILIQILLLPFAIVFGYSMLMGGMSSSMIDSATKVEKAYYINAPESISKAFDEIGMKSVPASDLEKIKKQIKDKESNLLLVFPEDFGKQLTDINIADVKEGKNIPDVEIWYNSEKTASNGVYSTVKEILNSLQPKIFTVNAEKDNVSHNLGDENYEFRHIMGTIFPMMVFMAIFMVCMNLAANSIAGDKERGFLNTMLITPVKRSSIAFGKSVSLFTASILGSLSAFIGMAVSLPQLSNSMKIDADMTYSVSEYILLFVITITAIFVLTAMLMIISALAKDVKQATTIAPIILMVLIIATMLTMNDNFSEMIEGLGFINNIIPVWNSFIMMQHLLQMNYSMTDVLISGGVNLVFAAILIVILGQLFKNEKIVNNT